ncbi:MAG: homoserine dehydrogenase [Nitriliruptoraceae bacterium]
MADAVRIGLLGCGTVGGAVVSLLTEHQQEITARTGAELTVSRIAVRDVFRQRNLALADDVFTTDAMSVVEADDIDIVVELIGGEEPAGALIKRALECGKPVVTANKLLLARHGHELYGLAASAGVDLAYEAAVAGAIPIIKPLKESLAGDRVTRVVGILNGTTNFILTQMTENGADYSTVLKDAQALGYAEADPTADVSGADAAAKCAILASLAFDTAVHADDVFTEGIEQLNATDISVADRLGYVIKLVGIASRCEDEIDVRVHPTFLPKTHPLASVRGAFNAIFVQAEAAGDLMFYGQGAGGEPTASAVVGDIIDVARNLQQNARGARELQLHASNIRPIGQLHTQYYVLLDVDDQPGVLADVATSFGDHNVSIAQVWQEGHEDSAQLVLVTHRAQEQSLRMTVEALRKLSGIRRVASVMRVESEVFA